MSIRMRRAAFTLIELLVVMVVILILVGILIPTITMIRRQAKDAQCTSNLQQLGIGITAFQQENNNYFPQSLSQMFSKGQTLEGEKPTILLCPHDGTKGGSKSFNRHPSMGDTSELYDPTHAGFFAYDTLKHSYMFEAAYVGLGSTALGWWPGFATWADAKVNQLKKGRSGGPYRPEDFPILRCFWHATWKGYGLNNEKKVLNLTWAMTTYWSIPEWENQIK